LAQHNALGIDGELYASTQLVSKGYKILEKNWRYKRDEIDLIVQIDNEIAFVEVKTRTNRYAGNPASHVTIGKQKRIIKAAQAYIEINDIGQEIRFDIISIILNKKEKSFEHIENAFYPF